MGYDFCLKCLKYTVFSVNFILWLFGLVIIGVAIWLRFDPQTTSIAGAAENLERYYIVVYILIGIGALMTLIGFVGCCGAYQESQCLLSMFFLFLLVIFGAEIGAATWAYTHKLELKTYVDQSLKDLIQHEYGKHNAKTMVYDLIQSNFKCCGADNPMDWNFSFFTTQKDITALPDSNGSDVIAKFPPSCCIPEALERFGEYCGDTNYTKLALNDFTKQIILRTNSPDSIDNGLANLPPLSPGSEASSIITGPDNFQQDLNRDKLYGNGMIWQRGCASALEEYFLSNIDIIIGIALAVIIIQLLDLLLSILLCCYVRRADLELDEYK